MIVASKLAGFLAAHAIWCVSDGETLIPILGYLTVSDERKMERLIIDDDLEASVIFGNQKLESNEMDASNAVFLYDGMINLDGVKLDAIIIQLRTYYSLDSKAIMAIPYTPQTTGVFRVHKPKLLQWENCEDFDLNAVLEMFFKGVNEHEKGAEIWKKSIDESK